MGQPFCSACISYRKACPHCGFLNMKCTSGHTHISGDKAILNPNDRGFASIVDPLFRHDENHVKILNEPCPDGHDGTRCKDCTSLCVNKKCPLGHDGRKCPQHGCGVLLRNGICENNHNHKFINLRWSETLYPYTDAWTFFWYISSLKYTSKTSYLGYFIFFNESSNFLCIYQIEYLINALNMPFISLSSTYPAFPQVAHTNNLR